MRALYISEIVTFGRAMTMPVAKFCHFKSKISTNFLQHKSCCKKLFTRCFWNWNWNLGSIASRCLSRGFICTNPMGLNFYFINIVGLTSFICLIFKYAQLLCYYMLRVHQKRTNMLNYCCKIFQLNVGELKLTTALHVCKNICNTKQTIYIFIMYF